MAIEEIPTVQKTGQGLREQVLRHVVKFSLGSLVGGIGSFFNSYFAALLLGPAVWGIWQGAKLVFLYGENLHLGVQNGMHRELPILRGKKEPERQAAIADVTFSFSLIVAILVSLGVLLSSFAIPMGSALRLSLQFIAAMIFLQYINSFYGSLFRARNEFDLVTKVAVIDGLGNLFSVALIFFFGFLGFLAGQVLRLLVATCYSYWKSSYSPNWRWDNRVLTSLILIGFPIMVMVFAGVIFSTIDRLLILRFLDAKSLGFYSLGNLVFAPLLMIFTASNAVMYPRFAERYGETGDPSTLRRFITVPMESLAALMSVLVGAIYVALPLLVRVFLPEYTEGVTATRILIFGVFFYSMAGMAGNMLLTINKQVLRLVILLVSALVNFGFSYAALRLGYGIEGVAAGTSVAYLIFFLVSTLVALRYSHAPLAQIWGVLARVVGPALYVACVAVLLSLTGGSSEGGIVSTVIKETILLGLSSYFLYKVWREGQVKSLLGDLFHFRQRLRPT